MQVETVAAGAMVAHSDLAFVIDRRRPRARRAHRRSRPHAELRLLVLVAPLRPDPASPRFVRPEASRRRPEDTPVTGSPAVARVAVFVSSFLSAFPRSPASPRSSPAPASCRGPPPRLPRRPGQTRCAVRCPARAGPGSCSRWGSWATRRTPSGSSCTLRPGRRTGLSSRPKGWRTTAASWRECPRSRSTRASCRAACCASRRWPGAPTAAGRGTRPFSPVPSPRSRTRWPDHPPAPGRRWLWSAARFSTRRRASRRGHARRRSPPWRLRGRDAVPRRSTRSPSRPTASRWSRPTVAGTAGSGSSPAPGERGARPARCSAAGCRSRRPRSFAWSRPASRTRRSCWPPPPAGARSWCSGRRRTAAGPSPPR